MDQERIADSFDEFLRAMWSIRHAITINAGPGRDANGGMVESLTESVMGVSAGTKHIAEALESVADAIREHTAYIEQRE